jgi:hypothetical protein
MLVFDEKGHIALLSLFFAGVRKDERMDLHELVRDPVLAVAGFGSLSLEERKDLVRRVDKAFRVDPRSSLSWREQFVRSCAQECIRTLEIRAMRPRFLSEEQMNDVIAGVVSVNRALAEKAGHDWRTVNQVLSSEYNAGFNHLFKDDDFIAVRRGGMIVEKIMLQGNDHNVLKDFIREAQALILSDVNINDFRQSAKAMRMAQAYSRVSEQSQSRSKGYGLRRED